MNPLDHLNCAYYTPLTSLNKVERMPISKPKGALIPNGYVEWVSQLKNDIRTAQTKAMLAVNAGMITLYWHIGREIAARQEANGWGSHIIPQLADDLRSEFPDMKGFSTRNLGYMKSFAAAWPSELILQQLAAKLPWVHNCVLIDKVKDPGVREWYARAACENGWSRAVLVHQIDTDLYRRDGKSQNNFELTVPPPQSDMVKAVFKDQYIFDFIELAHDAHERHLEAKLTEKVTKFLLEMGKGFAFLGSQYHIEFGGQDFYIDLLLYHTRLHRYVVIDLKMDQFTPEYAGKMNFYINLVNNHVKTDHDNPTVGLILCRERNNLIVDYSLGGIVTPIAVSDYRPNVLPHELAKELPKPNEMSAKLVEIMAEAEGDEA